MKTFKQLTDDVLRWHDEVTNEGTVRANVKQAINAAQRARLTAHRWPFMKWDQPVTFSTVAGQRTYTLHQEFHRGIYFYNTSTRTPLREITDHTLSSVMNGVTPMERFLDTGASWLDAEGDAELFEFRGLVPVARQPVSAGVLTVLSSSSSDSAKTVTVEGETANGIEQETLATGGSGAAAAGSVSFSRILRVTKGDNWSGTMTLRDAVGNTLLQLFASEYAREYRQLYLFAEPTAAQVIQYDFERRVRPLVADNDIPQMPEAFVDLLVYDALLAMSTYNPVEGGAVKLWQQQQQTLETAMVDTYLGPSTLDAMPAYINYIPRG